MQNIEITEIDLVKVILRFSYFCGFIIWLDDLFEIGRGRQRSDRGQVV